MSNILLLEDDLSLINGLSFAFKKQGFELVVARTLKEADSLWMDGKYDLLVLDVSLPDGTGFRMDFMIFAEPSAMEGHWIVKDERPVSYFTLGDVGYYQYTNNASTGICWLNGRVSGLVSGKVPAEVIRSIVYSIH